MIAHCDLFSPVQEGSQGEDGTDQHGGKDNGRVAWNLDPGNRNAGWELADPCISFPSTHTHNVFCPGSRAILIGSLKALSLFSYYHEVEQRLHVQPNGFKADCCASTQCGIGRERDDPVDTVDSSTTTITNTTHLERQAQPRCRAERRGTQRHYDGGC